MAVRVIVDYDGLTYKSAVVDSTFDQACEMFDTVIKEITHISLELEDGSRLYMAGPAASRAVIRVIQEA